MAIISVPIAKGGKEASIDVDTAAYSDEVYAYVLAEGLKAIANARMSKVGAVTKLSGKELEDAQAMALKIATENLDKLASGEVKKAKGKSASGEDRKVTTEARRLGREVIKDMIKAAKGRIGDYSAKQITEAADELIKGDPSFVVKAKENLASRNDTLPVLDIGALIQPDAKKVAKRKADEASKPLSAKQAGMTGKVPPRRKPQEVHTQH